MAVSLDESLDAVRNAERDRATHTVATDPYRKGSAAYPVARFAIHILINREEIARDVALAELNAEQIVARVAAILESGGCW